MSDSCHWLQPALPPGGVSRPGFRGGRLVYVRPILRPAFSQDVKEKLLKLHDGEHVGRSAVRKNLGQPLALRVWRSDSQ